MWLKRLAIIFLCISLLASSVFAVSEINMILSADGGVILSDDNESSSSDSALGDAQTSSGQEESSSSSDSSESSSSSSDSSSSSASSSGKGNGTSSTGSSSGGGTSSGGGSGSSGGSSSGGSSGGGSVSGEVRAVWLTYINIANIQRGKTESQFRSALANYFSQCKDLGLNTVYFHVRAFGDALYQSSLFPWSYLSNAAGVEGRSPGYDPAAIIIEVGHQYGLSMHAWFNPYRGPLTSQTLADSNKLKQWYGDETKVVTYGGRYYYNPASAEVQQHIINGVLEVVRGYNIDGVHLDDYFYPTRDASFDAVSYNAYKAGGGTLGLIAWRQNNVNNLVRNLYSSVKSVKNIPVSISPQGNMDNNINTQCANIPLWVSSSGYVDYIIPQLYWGYTHATAGYSKMIAQWTSLTYHPSVKLVVGLGIYRLGENGGYSDWTSSDGTYLVRMIQDAKASSHYKGFAIYEMNYLFQPVAATERANLKAYLHS